MVINQLITGTAIPSIGIDRGDAPKSACLVAMYDDKPTNKGLPQFR